MPNNFGKHHVHLGKFIRLIENEEFKSLDLNEKERIIIEKLKVIKQGSSSLTRHFEKLISLSKEYDMFIDDAMKCSKNRQFSDLLKKLHEAHKVSENIIEDTKEVFHEEKVEE